MERRQKASDKKARRSYKIHPVTKVILFFITFFVVSATIFKLIEFVASPDRNYEQNSFPRLELTLTNVPIEQIDVGDKTTRYPDNTVTITTDAKSKTFKNVEIKGHGNSTWFQAKKPYRVKFQDKENFFDLGAARKWLLLANSLDATHLRNDTAFFLEKVFGDDHAISGNFIDFYIDEKYRGLYYLTEKIEISKSRINLRSPLGIIVEIDNAHADSQNYIYSSNHNCIITQDFVNKDNADLSINNFMDKFNLFEQLTKSGDYEQISNLVDVDSFARYFLVNEFSNNHDGYHSSFFMYTDGEDDKIHAGPGWDFDLSFGNKSWIWIPEEIDSGEALSPTVDTVLKEYTLNIDPYQSDNSSRISTIIYDLLSFPEFQTRVKEIYQSTLSGKKDELLGHIRSQADYIRDAAYRDQARWKLDTDFNIEVDYLLDWVSQRYDHFEETYGAGSPDLNF